MQRRTGEPAPRYARGCARGARSTKGTGAGRALRAVVSGGVGLGLAAWLAWPAESQAWSALGGTLDLAQRDFRVFDNFTDPTIDNTLHDVEFPGATGPVLAIWKAAVEWGSELHGQGQGDPSQPLGLGSGGANFDFTFQGEASDVGGPDDNVVSEVASGLPGVQAYAETPIENGWRIRFIATGAVWDDGPGNPVAGATDLQGVATHELGHALGLGHSTVSGATMRPNTTGNLVYMRSLAPDDIEGVQALYGARTAQKPHVETYEVQGASLVLTGTGFAGAGNEVWFTRAGTSGDGTPVVVGGLVAQRGGTRLALSVPAEAAAGDVLVRVPGTAGDALSNAFPFDPTRSPCPKPRAFGPAKTTSTGNQVRLGWNGFASLATQDFVVRAQGGPLSSPGILISGTAEGTLPFYGGTLNVGGAVRRERAFAFDFVGTTTIPIPVDPADVGTTRTYQLWFHDPGDAFGVGLSDGLAVTFCP